MKGILLIPMAGEGNRFKKNGYSIPKQLIELFGKTCLEWSLGCLDYSGFKKIFIVRQEHIEKYNIKNFILEKFGNDSTVISCDKTTDGTVSTCLLAEKLIDNDNHLIITTLDVFFKPKIKLTDFKNTKGGTILVFNSENKEYSYSKIDNNDYVIETKEKSQISNNASVGIYHFSKGNYFVKYAKKMIKENIRNNNEFYICPLYNLLINDGLKIKTIKSLEVYPIGTPEEINQNIIFLKNE